MKKFLGKRCLAFLLLLTMIVTQCMPTTVVEAATTKKTVAVKSVKLSKKTLLLDKGKSAMLKVTISPKSARKANLQWKSSKKSVVSVSQNGKITAKKKGTAKITVTAKSGGKKKSASCTVKVLIPVSKVKLSPSKVSVKVKQKMQLKVRIFPLNASYRKVVYKSSNTEIVTVDSKGLIVAKKPGKAKIVAQVKNTKKKASIPVTVVEETKPSTSKPSEAKPSEAKPSESKPSEAKPSEAKPSETKPSEAKPSEAKPSESKPSESKPSEAKPGTDIPSASKPSEETPSMQQPSKEMPAMTPSSPSESSSIPQVKPSTVSTPKESVSEKPSSESSTPKDPLQSKLEGLIQIVKKMKQGFTDESERKKVEQMIQTAEEAVEKKQGMQEQVNILQAWKTACYNSITMYIKLGSRSLTHYWSFDYEFCHADYVIRQKDVENVWYEVPDVTSKVVDIRKSDEAGYTHEVSVQAANSYTVVWKINQIVIAEKEPTLGIKSVSDGENEIYSYSIKYREEKDGNLVYHLSIRGESPNGLTEAFQVIPNQEGASVKYEKMQNSSYAKQVTISMPGAKTVVYYVDYSMEDSLWDLYQVKLDGKIYTPTRKYDSSVGYVWNVESDYQEGQNVEVIPARKDTQATVMASDKQAYEKKITFSANGKTSTAYLSFTENKTKATPKILDVYRNGKEETWYIKSDAKGNQILYVNDFLKEDELSLVPVKKSTVVEIKDSSLTDYVKEVVLTDKETKQSQTYYVPEEKASESSDEEESTLKVEKIVDGEIQYVHNGNEMKPDFDEDWKTKNGVRYDVLILNGLQKPTKWNQLKFETNQKDATARIADSDKPDYDKTVTFTYRDGKETKVYYIKWKLINAVFNIDSVIVDGKTYTAGKSDGQFQYDREDDIGSEYVFDGAYERKLTVYGSSLDGSSNIEVKPKNPLTTVSGPDEDQIVTLSYQGGTETYTKRYKIQTELAESVWHMQSVTVGDTVFASEKKAADGTIHPYYYTVSSDTLKLFGPTETFDGDLVKDLQLGFAEGMDIKYQVLNSNRNDSYAKIRMEYQGKKKYLNVQYQMHEDVWNIKEIKIGDQVYPLYKSGMDSGSNYFKVTSSNIINMYGEKVDLDQEWILSMEKECDGKEVKVEDSDKDRYQKKITVSYFGQLKKYYVRYR
ncbi:MAG: Ig-like domain-containing protein [Lachnospiraceae bacterium]